MAWLDFDQGLVDEIASRMDLRAPNKAALGRIIEHIHAEEFHEVVCDLATGVGKTFLASALVDYLAAQGIRNVLIVTPGKTIQDKSIGNFTPASPSLTNSTASAWARNATASATSTASCRSVNDHNSVSAAATTTSRARRQP